MNRLTEMRRSHEHYVKCIDTSTKAVREMTMYLLLRMCQGFVAFSFRMYFGISERTMYRYIKELKLCGVTPDIMRIGNDIMIGERYIDNGEVLVEYGMGELEAPQSSNSHILRLHRFLQIYEAFEYEFQAAFWDEDYNAPKDGRLSFEFGPTDVIKYAPERSVDLRTVQRDFAVIAEAVEYFRVLFC